MRGEDQQQNHMFSYLPPEEQVLKDHPLRTIRAMVDAVRQQLSRRFDAMYLKVGRPSIPPEQLLRAHLLQMLYSICGERLLMEEIDYSMLFRWFIRTEPWTTRFGMRLCSPRIATACWKPTWPGSFWPTSWSKREPKA